MALIYSDEGFPRKVSEMLIELGHDVLTVQEAGQANQQIPDDQVLAYATRQNRAVLTVIDLTSLSCTNKMQTMLASSFAQKI